MLKIAYIVSTLKKSGPINVLYNIIKYLDKSQCQIYIISLSPEIAITRKKEFENIGCKVFNLNMGRVEGVFKAKKEIKKIIKDNEINIVHGHGIRADGIISKISSGNNIKTCSTLHNYPYYDYVMTYGKLKGYIMASFHIRYLKKIKSANACSKSISNFLMENKDYRINYVQNGIDLENYYKVSVNNKELLRKKLGLPLDKKVYISVGHLSDRKDPLTIINAFIELNDRYLVFLGDGHLKHLCNNKISKSKNIDIKGFVSNVSEYLQASDYFISASKAEGLPNTVMEAMACGLPCLLSDISPHIEILEFDKKCGRIFKKENVNDIIEKVIGIEKENYNELSLRAQELVKNNLSADIMSKKYQKIYRTLINN